MWYDHRLTPILRREIVYFGEPCNLYIRENHVPTSIRPGCRPFHAPCRLLRPRYRAGGRVRSGETGVGRSSEARFRSKVRRRGRHADRSRPGHHIVGSRRHRARNLADLGDRVQAGQVLVRLDNERQQYSLPAAAGRAHAHARAVRRARIRSIFRSRKIRPTSAAPAPSSRRRRSAFNRASELLKRELISQQTFDDAQADCRPNGRATKWRCRMPGTSAPAFRRSEAAVKLSDRQLRDTEIRAPFDGYVERRLVNLGELVKSQMPVMSIVRLDPLKVTAEIPERMAPWIDDGRPVDLLVDAYPGRTFTGKVTRISPAVNTGTRAFPFEAVVPNGDGVLKPGTFARVHVESGKVDEVLTLPFDALQYRYGVNRVFVVSGNRLEMRELQVGERLGDRIEVTSGVKPGERVAITDVETLNGGELVAVTS